MANFFTQTKNDFRYLKVKSSKLSHRAKRRKLRAILTLIGLLIVIFQLIFTVLFITKVIQLDMFPYKYIIVGAIALTLITLYNFLSQFAGYGIIGKIIAILLSVVMVYGYFFTAKLNSTLTNLTGITTQTDVFDVLVLKTDSAASLNDTFKYTYGINTSVDAELVAKAINNINSEYNTSINTADYTDWEEIFNALYENVNIKAIIIRESTRTLLLEQFPEIEEKTKICGTISVKTDVVLDESDKAINNQPFVIYLCGNDTEGSISDDGRNDVNILAVINPVTRQVLLVSTPRDSYIQYTNASGKTGYDKLTHASNDGIKYSIKALEGMYGIGIDYYVRVNFSGCIGIVDALGGITINSDVAFTNGIDACWIQYDFVVGPNECDGTKTLAFVRERQVFPNGDLQRGKNQEAAISAIIDKATSPAILSRYGAVLDSVSSMMLTNISSKTIASLVKGQLSNSTSWNIQSYSITGTGAMRDSQLYNLSGMSVVLLDDSSIALAKELMNKTINGEIFNVEDYQ